MTSTTEIKVNGNTYFIDNETIDYTYRSHINGMYCTCPDSWVSGQATDFEGKEYTVWYKVADETALDEIDYETPDDIVDEYGKIVYDKEN